MIDLTKWPTGDDVADYCIGAGLSISCSQPQINLMALQAQAAASEFERLTRWHPFLSSDTPESRAFEFSGGPLLDLAGGLVSLTSLTMGGQAMTLNQQFWLKPDNGPLEGRPYTAIDFGVRGLLNGYGGNYGDYGYGSGMAYFPSGGGQRSILVTGLWGYCVTLPADVWFAVLQRAAASAARVAGVARARGLKSFSEAGVEETYRDNPYGDLTTGGSGDFADCVQRYRRLVVA